MNSRARCAIPPLIHHPQAIQELTVKEGKTESGTQSEGKLTAVYTVLDSIFYTLTLR